MSESEQRKEPFIVLSSGGTGGHMSPASALASDLKSRGYRVGLATDQRGLKYKSMFEGIPIYVVNSGTAARGITGKIKGAVYLIVGIVQAIGLLLRLKPDLVVGFGGYPSVPVVLVAQYMKIPTILHEQNAIIGKANDFLASKAERIALSLPGTKGLDDNEKYRSVVTGNPVRPDVGALFTKPYPAFSQDGELRILVMGGSLGASVFSDVIPKALAGLSADHKKRLDIVQQCRVEDLDQARLVYEEAGIKASLSTFIDDVAKALSDAHLVIARSGASTVAEITAAGRPAIFVPYPHHKDQQQKMNADSVADHGGAWVMTEPGFTQEALLAQIEMFLQNPESLFRAAEKSREVAKPDAARKLGNLVTAVVSGWKD
ncbi:MAG: undecaprenyldiphospho-muramoylpentapeptide beta-N-acetylglucosaminyltransferase [Alphaproteobacteria bacterium]|nr:undecaprenyldiphospho-muramoylpentapeptide beta-N-acetylglucosaminyltransferase [Alphaproteobacteria bacterium]